MKKTALALWTAMVISLPACALAATPEPTATYTPAPPTATDTEVPPTPTATYTPTETMLPTPTPFAPFNAFIAPADSANLRAGPGMHFLIVKVLKAGSQVLLLGRSQGNEWFFVEAYDSTKGWVYGKLMKQTGDLLAAPVIEPENSSLIRGRVVDAIGTPITGLVFTVRLSSHPEDPANVVTTDANGEFFSYQPYLGGVFTVTFKEADCSSNAWYDQNCDYYKKGYMGIVSPPSRAVRVPQEGILEFTWG
jgi:uncharacterized protein YgiM (DUF1202 family)